MLDENNLTLEEKVQRVQAGRLELLKDLCLHYDRLVYKLAFENPYKSLGEDGLAQARLSLIEGFYQYDVERGVPLTAYVCGYIRQALWQELRKRNRLWQREWVDDGNTGGVIAAQASADHLEDGVLDQLIWSEFEAQLGQLPERQRAVLRGLAKGDTASEVAQGLEISVQAVYALRKRAQDRLKKQGFWHVLQ